MKTLKYLAIVLAGLIIFAGCQKEYSMESGLTGSPAKGSLESVSGDCLPITVNGDFIKDSTLTDSSYVVVQVNISTPGTYKLFTQPVNGYSFFDSGYVTATGLQNIRLKASGKPVLSHVDDFIVFFNDTSTCMFSITVTDSAVGQASYTLSNAANVCSNANVQGTYEVGTPLTAANAVSVEVDVTTLGKYALSTASTGGMTFSSQGVFAATGIQTITLAGSGTPTTVGANQVPISAGGTSCGFTVNVDSAANGGGGGAVNDSDSAWEFSQGTLFFHGSFSDVSVTPVPPGLSALSFSGSTSTGDTALSIILTWQGTGNPPLGNYSTATNTVVSFIDGTNGDIIYSADPTTTGIVTTVVISSYDAATKIITGTFSGNVKNKAGQTVAISGGKFKAQVS